jgi:hypothetical protein
MVFYGKEHCKSISKEAIAQMKSDHWVEINYNSHRKDKPPTVEIRVPDSNIPEYIIAAVTILRILTIAQLKGKSSPNNLTFETYELSKQTAAKKGVRGDLYWNDQRVKIGEYIDLFFDAFHEELEREDLTTDILDVFRWAKLGWNNSRIIRTSINHIKSLYSPKKYNWEKQFIKRYNEAVSSLLDGNNLIDYARILYVDLPDIRDIQIGKHYSL